MNFLKRWFNKNPLTTEQVRFAYSDKEILRNITLNLKKSQIISIVGKSGSGKSTFLKLIAGIISTNYKGKIRIFGIPKLFNKSRIGFVPQELSMIPDLSLIDNIKIAGLNLGITESKALKKADELMRLLKLEENINKKPTELSGGQKARFNIILSLLHDPEILILDEPFVGLDFLNRRLLWHFLESMRKKGKAILLTSHLLTETQEHADKIIILKNGSILFQGNLEQLKSKLKIQFILETRFSQLSKSNQEKIRKYCIYKDVKILDDYEKYMMFALNSEKSRTWLFKFFEKLKLNYEEISFREPNLDEVFLKA